MRKVTPDRLEAGMKLAKPVLRGSTVILGEGMVLSESTVSRIQDMEIDHLFVEGSAEQSVPLEEALTLLDQRFTGSEDNQIMMHIKSIVQEHIRDLYE